MKTILGKKNIYYSQFEVSETLSYNFTNLRLETEMGRDSFYDEP